MSGDFVFFYLRLKTSKKNLSGSEHILKGQHNTVFGLGNNMLGQNLFDSLERPFVWLDISESTYYVSFLVATMVVRYLHYYLDGTG
jgi:hypothetical protein